MENEEVKNEEEVNTSNSESTTEEEKEDIVVEEKQEVEEKEVKEETSSSDTNTESNVEPSITQPNSQNDIVPPFENVQPQFEMAPAQFEEVQRKPQVVRTDSYFDGGLLELIGWRILAFLITGVTLGIAYPWAACMLYNYQFKHTVYNGKRLKFEGTGGDLFVNMFKWIFFTLITCGIYAFFIPVSRTKWVISNLHFEDEDYISGDSYFDGNTFQLIGVNILCNLLTIFTLGLLYPFSVCFRLKWINKHAIINRKRLIFKGRSLNLWGKYLLWAFLTIITFGIYGLWLGIKMLKWQTKNTSIRLVGEKEVKDTLTYIIMVPILLAGLALVITMLSSIPKLVNNDGEGFNIKYLNPFYLIYSTKNTTDSRKKYIERDEYSEYCPSDWKYDNILYTCYSYDYNQKECSADNNYYEGNKCYTQAYGSGESISQMKERMTLIKNGKIKVGIDSLTEYKKLKGTTTKSNTTTQPSKVVPSSNKTSNVNSDVILLSKNVKYAVNSDAFQCNKCFSQSYLNKIKKAKGYYVYTATSSLLEYDQIVALSSPYNSTKYYGTSYRSELFKKATNIGGGGGENLKLTAAICKKHNLNCK